jgi:hypothetical protein
MMPSIYRDRYRLAYLLAQQGLEPGRDFAINHKLQFALLTPRCLEDYFKITSIQDQGQGRSGDKL